ncbi:MAG: alpha-xylosidase [Streptococcaceae bacterium]|jgi:alpha-glucosidase (family GH31 glycosyl hydrolase)|nr:alpha-xylosidase [Streptococcaceae bacterium]
MEKMIKGRNYRFTLLTNWLIRLEFDEAGLFEDRPTQIVINRELDEVDYHVIDKGVQLEIITEAFHLYYQKEQPFSAANLFIDVKYNYSIYGNRWYYGSRPEEVLPGTARTLDNVNGETELEDSIIGKNGFGILKDESLVLNDKDTLVERHGSLEDVYYFAYGRDYLHAIKDYYRLTGPTPLLPKYALGNWWSRYWPYEQQEYIDLMDKFMDERVPLSVSVIDMDWHRVNDIPNRFGSGWTGYSWNKTLFPNPKIFFAELHKRKLAITLNLHPADGIRAFEDTYPAVAQRMGLNTELEEAAIFKIDDPLFRTAYFEDVHHPIEEQGCDFWWIDWQQGTGADTGGIDYLWLLNHYHYLDVQRKGRNDVILSRYAGPGSHRYPIGFSGDTIISWNSLDFQPFFTNSASNIGYTWWSHDIGGHMRGYRDDELFLRWIQYGVFSPINRLHSAMSNFTSKEPWSYPKEIMEIVKNYLQLRHQLIPYLYTMNVLTHEEGLPLIKPMYYYYPENEAAYTFKNQYFFGTELLIAPITSKSIEALQMSKTTVWLPGGVWYDFFTGVKYSGNQIIDIYRERCEYPIFVKAGAIIPLNADAMDNATRQIDWHIFPGENHEFELCEDIDSKRHITSVKNVDGNITIVGGKHRVNNIVMHSSVDNYESRLYHRLDIAQIEYTLKDDLFNQLTNVETLAKSISILNTIENKDLRASLFEVLLTK